MILPIKRLDAGLPLPEFANPSDAGMDLRSTMTVDIAPGETVMVGTGISVAIPEGYVGLVFARSGLGAKGLTLSNCVGVIDPGYRGEIMAPMHNNHPVFVTEGDHAYRSELVMHIERGDRIVQLVIVKLPTVEVVETALLPDSERGTDGFGSSGVD